MASSVKEKSGYIGCDYYSWNIENLEIAHKSKATASARPNNTFLPGNIVIVCASTKEGLFAFLGEAKYVYPDRTAKDIWHRFHRPEHLVTALKVLSPIKKVPMSIHGALSRSGIATAHRKNVVEFLRGNPPIVEIKKQEIKPTKIPLAAKPVIVKTPITKPKSLYGFVYLLQDHKGVYKIGITDNPKRRFKELEVGIKAKCIGYWSCDDYKEIEKHLHLMFNSERIPQCEWFHLSQVQMNFACEWLDKHATRIPIVESKPTNSKTSIVDNNLSSSFIVISAILLTVIFAGAYIEGSNRNWESIPSYSRSVE